MIMKLLRILYKKFQDSRIITWVSNTRVMQAYLRLPKWGQIVSYIIVLAISAVFGGSATYASILGANAYEHYQMTRYGVVDPEDRLSLIPENIIDEFEGDGYAVVVRPDNDYFEEHPEVAGVFMSDKKLIVMKEDEYGYIPYHEMGHYVDWKCGDVSELYIFQKIYEEENGDYSYYNAEYSRSDASEYFASCFAEYYLNPVMLKETCPRTYWCIGKCIDMIF